MSTIATEIKIDETAVRAAAEKTIAETCARHGVTREELKPEAIEGAYNHAREVVTAEEERKQNPYYQENVRLREELRAARMESQALRDARPGSGQTATTATSGTDPDIVAQRLGPAVWNHQLDSNGRLAACGINPSINTAAFRAEIKEYFGPGSSSMKAAELARTNHPRYKLLKNAGKALRLI